VSDLNLQIAAFKNDKEHGASELLSLAIGILRVALTAGVPIRPVARALVEAQPSMAPIWTAAAQAIAAERDLERFDRFVHQVAHAPRALVRHALTLLVDDRASRPLSVATISFSRSVFHVMEALRARCVLHVSCGEGRPALEGRRLAQALAALDVPVTCYSDAALGNAIAAADAVLVGADAVTPEWFLNKVGTRMLAAVAAQAGVPVYVVASRDKFVPATVAARLRISEGAAAEIWDSPSALIAVRNPYFEPIPLDLASAFITDVGVLGAALVPDVCNASPLPADF
jgi:translation initiation factor 2B subunit (eIF-2B alpha/beta/delta family)